MNDRDQEPLHDDILRALLREESQTSQPSDALLARVLGDAADVSAERDAAAQTMVSAKPRRATSWWRLRWPELVAGAAAMTATVAVGAVIGYTDPANLSDVLLGGDVYTTGGLGEVSTWLAEDGA
jgi:hypothetical protein